MNRDNVFDEYDITVCQCKLWNDCLDFTKIIFLEIPLMVRLFRELPQTSSS